MPRISDPSAAPSDTVIFLHLPRSAGMTLNRVVARQFPAEAILKVGGKSREDTHAEIAATPQTRLITGHFAFGLHTAVAGAARYITIVRDPVKRFVSHFYSAKYSPQHHLHEAVKSGSLTMQEAVPLLSNILTRYVAGDAAPTTAESANEQTLAVAKENLARHFTVVGTADRFEETLGFLHRRLGWKVGAYTSSNVNRARPASDLPDPADLDFFREHNQLDLALYAWVKDRFEQEIREEGRAFRWQVARWCWRQKASGWKSQLTARLRPAKSAAVLS